MPLWLAALTLLVSMPAYAAGSATLNVGATVLSKNNCKFDTTPAPPNTLAFGAINPSGTGSATAPAINWQFTCKGSATTASYVVTVGTGQYYSGGTRRMRHGTTLTEFLPYSVSVSPASGNATKNVPVILTISGTILQADYQSAIAGAFSDSVTISVAP